LAKSVIDDDDLVITANNIGLLGWLAVDGWDRVARISLEEKSLFDSFGDELLSLRFVVLNALRI
jgi:hypothetical protein